jgi:hypothetical protein
MEALLVFETSVAASINLLAVSSHHAICVIEGRRAEPAHLRLRAITRNA